MTLSWIGFAKIAFSINHIVKQFINSNQIVHQQQDLMSIKQNSLEEQQKSAKFLPNYIIGRTVGKGTFNKVKIGKHIGSNEQVAIKIIEKSKLQTQSDYKRLNKELKILRRARHPNIIQLLQILEDANYYYVITQYAVRGELYEYIVEKEKLTEFEACKFLQQLLDAVEYLHEIGVSHRDLKPENILLDYKYNLKIVDFGLSNIYSKGQKLQSACGSPCYASPEMLEGKPYDGMKNDIWSIGIILYAMCVGYLPFDEENTGLLYRQIIQGKYEVPNHASEELKNILNMILQVDPEKRASIHLIRNHKFCKFSPFGEVNGIVLGLSIIPIEPQIEKMMRELNMDTSKLREFISTNKHNTLTATYYLLLQQNLRLKNETFVSYYTKRNYFINRYKLIQRMKSNYERKTQQLIEKMHAKYDHLKKSKRKKSSSKKRSKTSTKVNTFHQGSTEQVFRPRILFGTPQRKKSSSKTKLNPNNKSKKKLQRK